MADVFLYEMDSKFWEITVDDCEFLVRYGKQGTDGRNAKPKEFDTPEDCQTAAAKLIASKEKKGYELVQGDANNLPQASGGSSRGGSRKRKKPSSEVEDAQPPRKKKPRRRARNDDEDEDGLDDSVLANDFVYMEAESKSGGKFWEVRIDDLQYVTRYGKVHATGRSITKHGRSQKDIRRTVLRLIQEKRDKGYEIVRTDGPPDEEEEDEEDDDVQASDMFNGKIIVVSGTFSKSQKDIKYDIESNGGTVKSSVTLDADLLIVGSNYEDLSSTKCDKAISRGIPIVAEAYLKDCIKQGAMLPFDDYNLGDEQDDG